ncbi:hypothetical protein GGF46_004461 [Coemansia sp. RSA 552]|nr:hypothetical protein GGF46_004461 [Coemansia sp. RSA 552]
MYSRLVPVAGRLRWVGSSSLNRLAIRHASRSSGGKQRRRDRDDDRFKYDMKEPLMDAGIANIFRADPNMVSVLENLPTGFRLSNNATFYGPLLVVNNTPFTLKIPPPKSDAHGRVQNPISLLDPQALELLRVVVPKPELVVVGGGASISQLSTEAHKYLTSIGLKVELASTKHATSTFNTLSEEGRNAALLAIPAGVAAH